LLLLALAGCRLFDSPDGAAASKSILRPARPSPDSVAVEVRLVLVPDRVLPKLDEIWLHADEQALEPDVRRELARNGFRAGIIGPAPPPGLSELLPLEGSVSATDDAWQSVPLDKQPAVTGHQFQLRPNKRVDIQASPVHDATPILVATDAGLTASDYELVQGLYALQWTPLPQDRIQIEVTPELHFGVPRNQYAAGAGHDLHRTVAKSRQVFEQLRMKAPLLAGQMLLISADPQAGGSLGHFFHTVPTSDGSQYKVVLIRLAQIPP
jgi:hypothetical protein